MLDIGDELRKVRDQLANPEFCPYVFDMKANPISADKDGKITGACIAGFIILNNPGAGIDQIRPWLSFGLGGVEQHNLSKLFFGCYGEYDPPKPYFFQPKDAIKMIDLWIQENAS